MMVCFFTVFSFSKKVPFFILSSQNFNLFLYPDDNYRKAIFKFSKKVPNFFLKIAIFLHFLQKKFFQKNFVPSKKTTFITITNNKIKQWKTPQSHPVTEKFCTLRFFRGCDRWESQNFLPKKGSVRVSHKKFCTLRFFHGCDRWESQNFLVISRNSFSVVQKMYPRKFGCLWPFTVSLNFVEKGLSKNSHKTFCTLKNISFCDH